MDKRERYAVGRSYTEVEYGVRLPDGTVDWYGDGTFGGLGSVGGRKRWLENRAERLRGLGIKDPGVEFLSRVKKTKFSTPEPVRD